jgi:transposase
MDVVYARCCGLDVHLKTVVACVLLTQQDGRVVRKTHTFQTMIADLLALRDWLDEWGVTHVAMESTGVYWRPVYNVLEDEQRTLLLVNAQHVKNVPGRKTDLKDAEWLADLLRHGLLRPSFVPPQPIRALRELTRYRSTLLRERTAEVNRLQKTLEGANIKWGAVASDILGVSGRDMLGALLGGEQDPEVLAELARGKLRAKLPELRRALEGRVQPYHVLLIGQILAHIDFLEESIATVQEAITQRVEPFQEDLRLMQSLPGIKEIAAATILAEIGADMARFPSAQHLASWAGVCPGNKQSGGRRLSGKTTPGNVWLRAILGEVAWAAIRTKDSYFRAQYYRLARRRGKNKALMAVAHSILTVLYHVLRERRPYRDLGADYFDRLDATRIERHHVRRLEQLGYKVDLTPAAVA